MNKIQKLGIYMEVGRRRKETYMSEQRSHIVTNFVVRALLGAALIFFVNEFLASKDVSLSVGMNPLTVMTSGVFGAPGVALLYGIAFYKRL